MYRLVSNYQLNAKFLYFITIYMSHYNPQHVSSSTLLIFGRTNCIITASGIVTLCKQPYSMPLSTGILKKSISLHILFQKLALYPARKLGFIPNLYQVSEVMVSGRLNTLSGSVFRCLHRPFSSPLLPYRL